MKGARTRTHVVQVASSPQRNSVEFQFLSQSHRSRNSEILGSGVDEQYKSKKSLGKDGRTSDLKEKTWPISFLYTGQSCMYLLGLRIHSCVRWWGCHSCAVIVSNMASAEPQQCCLYSCGTPGLGRQGSVGRDYIPTGTQRGVPTPVVRLPQSTYNIEIHI